MANASVCKVTTEYPPKNVFYVTALKNSTLSLSSAILTVAPTPDGSLLPDIVPVWPDSTEFMENVEFVLWVKPTNPALNVALVLKSSVKSTKTMT